MNAEENSAVCLFILEYGRGRSLAMRIPSQSASKTLQGKRSRFYCRGRSLPSHLQKQNPHTILYVSRAALVISTRKSVLEGSCFVNCNKTAITSGRQERWSLRNGDRNPRKAYALLKQYSGKMKRCPSVLNTANGVAVGEATLPIWKEHFKTLPNRLAPSAPELGHVHRPTYAVNEEPPTVSEVLVCIQKMKNGKSGGDNRISAEMLKYLPPSGIREMTKIIRSIWIDERIPDSWRHAIIIPLHKKLSVTDPRNYRGISLLRVMYKVLERIILDRLIKHREETTRDEQSGFRPGRSTIDQVFIAVIEIWQWYSKPMQLAFLDFEAAFDSPHLGHLLNALSADGVPGKFVRLFDDMNQRTTAAVRTSAGCTTPFEVVTGVRQGAVAGPFLFNFAIDDIMRRTVDQCPADIVLAPSGCPLTDLEYADDVVIFAESSTKLQHIVNLVSKLAAGCWLWTTPTP
ncbi:hypothetical protein RB195_016215 [Necator americanus]|uniref:Reverse transcriptase domain-containing protein n=1 Tax=Necator americanus TaxID=51031 RepID=A0ABR1E954_NECAM